MLAEIDKGCLSGRFKSAETHTAPVQDHDAGHSAGNKCELVGFLALASNLTLSKYRR